MPFYYDQYISIDAVNALPANVIIILHPSTAIRLAVNLARGLLANRSIVLLPETDDELVSAFIENMSKGNLILAPTMDMHEGKGIVRQLRPNVILVMTMDMPLYVRLAIFEAMPSGVWAHIEPRTPLVEIPVILNAIPSQNNIILSRETSQSLVEMVAKNLKKNQKLFFENKTPASLQLAAAAFFKREEKSDDTRDHALDPSL